MLKETNSYTVLFMNGENANIAYNYLVKLRKSDANLESVSLANNANDIHTQISFLKLTKKLVQLLCNTSVNYKWLLIGSKTAGTNDSLSD